jgi:hypothetical protein
MNTRIKRLHARFGGTVEQLSKRLGRTSDPTEAETIFREMEEVRRPRHDGLPAAIPTNHCEN